MSGELAAVDRYERIEGWRITEHERGPHPEVESCDEMPACLHVYRLVTTKEGSDA